MRQSRMALLFFVGSEKCSVSKRMDYPSGHLAIVFCTFCELIERHFLPKDRVCSDCICFSDRPRRTSCRTETLVARVFNNGTTETPELR